MDTQRQQSSRFGLFSRLKSKRNSDAEQSFHTEAKNFEILPTTWGTNSLPMINPEKRSHSIASSSTMKIEPTAKSSGPKQWFRTHLWPKNRSSKFNLQDMSKSNSISDNNSMSTSGTGVYKLRDPSFRGTDGRSIALPRPQSIAVPESPDASNKMAIMYRSTEELSNQASKYNTYRDVVDHRGSLYYNGNQPKSARASTLSAFQMKDIFGNESSSAVESSLLAECVTHLQSLDSHFAWAVPVSLSEAMLDCDVSKQVKLVNNDNGVIMNDGKMTKAGRSSVKRNDLESVMLRKASKQWNDKKYPARSQSSDDIVKSVTKQAVAGSEVRQTHLKPFHVRYKRSDRRDTADSGFGSKDDTQETANDTQDVTNDTRDTMNDTQDIIQDTTNDTQSTVNDSAIEAIEVFNQDSNQIIWQPEHVCVVECNLEVCHEVPSADNSLLSYEEANLVYNQDNESCVMCDNKGHLKMQTGKADENNLDKSIASQLGKFIDTEDISNSHDLKLESSPLDVHCTASLCNSTTNSNVGDFETKHNSPSTALHNQSNRDIEFTGNITRPIAPPRLRKFRNTSVGTLPSQTKQLSLIASDIRRANTMPANCIHSCNILQTQRSDNMTNNTFMSSMEVKKLDAQIKENSIAMDKRDQQSTSSKLTLDDCDSGCFSAPSSLFDQPPPLPKQPPPISVPESIDSSHPLSSQATVVSPRLSFLSVDSNGPLNLTDESDSARTSMIDLPCEEAFNFSSHLCQFVDDVTLPADERIQNCKERLFWLRNKMEQLITLKISNESKGKEIAKVVEQKCDQKTKNRYEAYVHELMLISELVDKMVNRLNDAETALLEIPIVDDVPNDSYMKLCTKKADSAAKLQDALQLKQSIDQRGVQLLDSLQTCMSSLQLSDYRLFITILSRLPTEISKINNQIKSYESTLASLNAL